MEIVYAIVFGTLFGFVLQRAGAADPDKIVGMLQLRDLHLMKVILLAIGLSSLLLFAGMELGLVDSSHLSVKSSYRGVVLGGMVLGLGWAVAGFCPGTGVVAAGAGRKDAGFFLLGGLCGAGLFTAMYGGIKDSMLFEALGGKVTLALTGHYPALLPVNGFVTAAVIAAVFVAVAWLLPMKLRD
jgi:hypothetical protein